MRVGVADLARVSMFNSVESARNCGDFSCSRTAVVRLRRRVPIGATKFSPPLTVWIWDPVYVADRLN